MTKQELAEQLSDVFMRKLDLKAEEDAIIDAAKAAGENVRALRKVAQELVMDSAKLAKRYDDEEQLEMFRAEVKIFSRKGLEQTDKAAAAAGKVGEAKLRKATREFDAVAGTDIAGNYERDRKKINAWQVGKLAE